MTSQDVNSKIITSLWYLQRLPIYTTQKPYYVNFPVPQNDAAPAQHNILHERYDGIDIHDIRGNEDAFKIDTHGFQLVRDSTSMSNDDFEQDSIIRQRYYPEIISLVTKTLGATRVVPFEHTHRLSRPNLSGCGCDRKRKPLVAAHIGETKCQLMWLGMYLIVSSQTKPQRRAANALRTTSETTWQYTEHQRFQIINVWRPLFGPLEDYPLALGDCRTFDFDRDGEPTDLVFPHYIGDR
ncbi:unnamed protein product [Clonostachys rosea f. rosea IK726]|uniref:Uncharacterized protein n=1 Tax=Clonostachys rosea f. rosea IK726 TaxID=1349383 RepID=A0ACA9U9R2_BIOOC|nr:unnamed protein product [Clonostachys rosea f. rosea IK726]